MDAPWLEAFRQRHTGGYIKAGKCLSCARADNCPGGRYRQECANYRYRQPGRDDWMNKYMQILRKLTVPHLERYKTVGQAFACRRAMLEQHGFSEEILREIEDSIEGLPDAQKRSLRWGH